MDLTFKASLLIRSEAETTRVWASSLAVFNVQTAPFEWATRPFLAASAEVLRQPESVVVTDSDALGATYYETLVEDAAASGKTLVGITRANGDSADNLFLVLAAILRAKPHSMLTKKDLPQSMRFEDDCHDTAARLKELLLSEKTTTPLLPLFNAFVLRNSELFDRPGYQPAKIFSEVFSNALRTLAGANPLLKEDLDSLIKSLGALGQRSWHEALNRHLEPLNLWATILIVEDDEHYARALAASLQAAYNRLPQRRYALEFAFHIPNASETQSDFRTRYIERITDITESGGFPWLQVVIFDRELSLPRGGGERVTGIELARLTRKLRPCVTRILATGTPVIAYTQSEQEFDLFRWVTSKNDPAGIEWQELFASIHGELESKYASPFWEALQDFSNRPIQVFHAMALSKGRSGKKSGVLADFLEFYGERYFCAETSATLDPLDSLLYPTGSLAKSMALAKRAFGSQQSLFVTNGTSTANKIVLQALLRPGDRILVDRNCHISHHYAIALTGAQPEYLEPTVIETFGLGASIPIETILASLEASIASNQGELPKAILLTNCTFDGVVISPTDVIEGVSGFLSSIGREHHLREIAFVFDEAWFAFARFHSRFVTSTGMAAAEQLCWGTRRHFYSQHLRVYVTQSTHKTLSSFRQGSMIHIWDPMLQEDPECQLRLNEAFLTHTSTSPHSGILASLDVARRQAELEGFSMISQAIRLAELFRHDFVEMPGLEDVRNVFRILGPDDLLHNRRAAPDNWQLDVTKITLAIKRGPSGDVAKKILLMDHDIQVNKTSHNTFLLMFNAGTTESAVANVWRVLKKLANSWSRFPERTSDSVPMPRFTRLGFSSTVPSPDQQNRLGFYFVNQPRWPIEFVPVAELGKLVRERGECLSATFVTPYPPGYPLLVPGQLVTEEYATVLLRLRDREIHGSTIQGDSKCIPVFVESAVKSLA